MNGTEASESNMSRLETNDMIDMDTSFLITVRNTKNKF